MTRCPKIAKREDIGHSMKLEQGLFSDFEKTDGRFRR